MTDAERQRKTLFAIYAANLTFVFPEAAGQVFVCPLCLQQFDEGCIFEKSPRPLSLGDIWPKALGRNGITLECRKCNNTIGSRYDKFVVKEFEYWRTFGGTAGDEAMIARMMFEYENQEHDVGITAKRGPEGFEFTLAPDHSDPKSIDALKLMAEHQPPEERKLSFKWKKPPPRNHAVGLMHSAYLALFQVFGYEYVYRAKTQWLRDMFLAKAPPDDVPTVAVRSNADLLMADAAFSVGILEFSNGLFAMGVALPDPNPAHKVRIIAMPGFADSGDDHFQRLLKQGSGSVNYSFYTFQDDPAIRLIDPADAAYGSVHWHAAIYRELEWQRGAKGMQDEKQS